MGVSGIASASTGIKQSQVQSAASTKMLRNSIDDQAQTAQDLLKSLPQSQTVLNPSYLGRNIDTRF